MSEAVQRAQRYLDSANLLLDEGDYESSVSRAYYAMFHVARALLRQKNVRPRSHSGLLNQFSLHFIRSDELPQHLGTVIGDAFELRQFAEYAEDFVISHNEAAELLGDAREFVAVLEQRLRQR